MSKLTCTLVSDLHLEYQDMALPGGDVLLLAGDIVEARELGKNNYNPDHIHRPGMNVGLRVDRNLRFFNEEVTKYRKAFYIAGNHEHYGTKYHKTHEFMRENVPANTTVLENDAVEFEGVLFLGATFWTDFNKGDGLTVFNARDRMNDYKHITMKNPANGAYHKLTTQYILDQHHKSKEYFKFILSENRQSGKNLPVVVMTHHAPCSLSVPTWYRGDYLMNGCYYSDQSDMILDNPEIVSWVHGHTHEKFDYMLGETRVLCNPRGYYGMEAGAHNYKPITFKVEGK